MRFKESFAAAAAGVGLLSGCADNPNPGPESQRYLQDPEIFAIDCAEGRGALAVPVDLGQEKDGTSYAVGTASEGKGLASGIIAIDMGSTALLAVFAPGRGVESVEVDPDTGLYQEVLPGGAEYNLQVSASVDGEQITIGAACLPEPPGNIPDHGSTTAVV